MISDNDKYGGNTAEMTIEEDEIDSCVNVKLCLLIHLFPNIRCLRVNRSFAHTT